MTNKMALLPINKNLVPIKFAVDESDRVIGLTLDDVIKIVNQFSDDERLDLFSNWCLGCGGKIQPCHCQNDE